MDHLLSFLSEIHSSEGIKQIIMTGGLWALVAIVFAETGLLVGFFLPGDSLLITAGIFAATDTHGGPGILNLWSLLFFLSVAAIIGDQVGYFLGFKTGPKIFSRNDSLLFKKKYAIQAHKFYEKYGGKAIIMARFIPVCRTFVPFVAGVAKMPYRTYLLFDIFGGLFWIFFLVLVGYFLGQTPLANELHKVILVVIFVSILPILFSASKALLSKIKFKK